MRVPSVSMRCFTDITVKVTVILEYESSLKRHFSLPYQHKKLKFPIYRRYVARFLVRAAADTNIRRSFETS